MHSKNIKYNIELVDILSTEERKKNVKYRMENRFCVCLFFVWFYTIYQSWIFEHFACITDWIYRSQLIFSFLFNFVSHKNKLFNINHICSDIEWNKWCCSLKILNINWFSRNGSFNISIFLIQNIVWKSLRWGKYYKKKNNMKLKK